MEQPIDEKSFIAQPGTSDYIWVYAGNTYRTVTADKKLELPLKEDISTISWDFYKNDGHFFAQMILFVSYDRDQRQKFDFSKNVASICLALERNLTKFNELIKDPDSLQDQLKQMPSLIEQILTKNLNVTVIMTFHDPKKITNSLQTLPEDCSIYVKTKFVEDNEEEFKFETMYCYVLTNENEHKLFFLEKTITNGQPDIIEKEIECKNLGALRKMLGESIYKSGILPDLSETLFNLDGKTHRSNLKILTDFLSRDQTASSKVGLSYTTLVINKGKHKITAVNPLMPTSPASPIENETKNSESISYSIQHYKAGEVLLVQSHPDLLNEKNLLDRLEQKDEINVDDNYNDKENDSDVDDDVEQKSTEEIFCFNFTNIPTKLAFEAETLRQQAAKTWQPPITQAWLLLVSRLWAFQTALEDKNFKLSDPADPMYACLMLANLTNFGYLQKALNITQKSPDDQVEIENEHVTEIKTQWLRASEAKSRSKKSQTTTSWKKAFRFHNPEAKVPVEHGKAIRLLCVDPVGHATKLPSFQAMPIPPHNKKILESRSIRTSIDENYKNMISVCHPAASNDLLTADTIREYTYTDDQLSYNQDTIITAKLTVLYSPVFIEKDNWVGKKFASERDRILFKLSGDIFKGIEHFLQYSAESLPIIRTWITDILTNSSFSGVNASLLFCLNIKQGHYQCRFLVGVGNNMALAFEQGKSQPITKIGAMYEVDNVAVSLSSMNKPDKLSTEDLLTTLLNPSRIRHEECIQIAFVDDPFAEILFILGRRLIPEFYSPMPQKKSKLGLRTFIPDIKSLNIIEEKNSSPIKNLVNALQARHEESLGFITNPNMISAWNKLERLLRAKEEKAPIAKPFFPSISFSRVDHIIKEPSDSQHGSDNSGRSSYKEEEEEGIVNLKDLNGCADCGEFIGGVNAYIETLNSEIDTELKESKENDKLTELESEMVAKLWQAAINEEKDLPYDGQNDFAGMERFPEMNWNKIREKYFFYFQGVTDSIALFVPTPTIEQPQLIEHIHGLGQFYFYWLTANGKGSEAQEILTFSHLLCLLPDEKAILKNINGKLKTFEQRYLEKQAPKFWIQLIKLLIFLYLPEKAYLSQNPVNNLEQLKAKLTEFSGSSSQTTSRSSELRSQSFLTTLSKVFEQPSSDYPTILYLPF